MRIGVLGGTFNPVHLGHLILAEQGREQGRLDEVWFIPSWRPPHKQSQDIAPFHHRAEMLALALAGHPAFHLNEVEKEQELVYTVQTLEALQGQYSDHDFYLLLGADCLPDLPKWREPARVVQQAALLVAARPGFALWPAEQLRAELGLAPDVPLRLQAVLVPPIGISSRDLRGRAREGRSLRYLVPRAVECYLETHQLYREQGDAS